MNGNDFADSGEESTAGAGANGLQIGKSRSRGGSYADLQRLRAGEIKPLSYSSALSSKPSEDHANTSNDVNGVDVNGADGVHRRNRRASLADKVNVSRIGELDRSDGFETCTKEINGEIEKVRSSG
jgi:hypothetical protein